MSEGRGRTWRVMTCCVDVSEPLKSVPPSSRARIITVALPACARASLNSSRPAAEMEGSISKSPGGDEAVLTMKEIFCVSSDQLASPELMLPSTPCTWCDPEPSTTSRCGVRRRKDGA